MEKLYITEELKAANIGKLDHYEIGQELELDQDQSFAGDKECERNATTVCNGVWVRIGGNCICNPTP